MWIFFGLFSPVAVPTSFEGVFGKIIYRVSVVIDTPRFSKDYKAQKPFYLLNLLNLNEVPDIEVSSWCPNLPTFQFYVHSFYSFNVSPAILFSQSKSVLSSPLLLCITFLSIMTVLECPGSHELSIYRLSAKHQLMRLLRLCSHYRQHVHI